MIVQITITKHDEIQKFLNFLKKDNEIELETAYNPASAKEYGKQKPVHVPEPAAPAPTTVPTVPTADNSLVAPTTPPTPEVQTSPVAAVPVANAPTYTRDQIMTAGAQLIDMGKQNELVGLLHGLGVNAITELKEDQLGVMATKLRELGARI